jgi:hypothetical protein
MEIPVVIPKEERFIKIIELMSCGEPFKSLRPKEKEAIGRLLYLTYTLKDIPKEQRRLLIFHQDNKKKLAEDMDMTIDNYYNLILSLRKKGLVDNDGIVEKYSNKLLTITDTLTFKFIEK